MMWRDGYRTPSGPGAGGPRGVARLIGEREPMRDLKAKSPRVAAAPFPVVVEGESGTGKELIARAIQEEGPRGRAVFVPVLRRPRRRAVRVGVVRARQGRFHRRGAGPQGAAGAVLRRHRVPRRGG